MSDMENVIEVKQLTKKFKKMTAVNAVSFDVRKGEIFGFLGPNGAGKSTTINMLATLLRPTSGDASINGNSIVLEKDKVRQSIGLVFQDPSLDEKLTAEENLRFHAQLYRVPGGEYRKRMEEVLRLVELWDRKNDIVKTYSGGMKRRLEIGRGLIHYPAVLFLDEPTIGLDPQTRAHIWQYVLKLKHEKKMTIFMTTHYMDEADYCDRIAVIDNGKIVALDAPDGLRKLLGGDIVRLKTSQIEKTKRELKKIFPDKDVQENNGILQMKAGEGEKILPRIARELTVPVESMELRKPTLDDVFIHLTGREIRTVQAAAPEKFHRGPR